MVTKAKLFSKTNLFSRSIDISKIPNPNLNSKPKVKNSKFQFPMHNYQCSIFSNFSFPHLHFKILDFQM